MQPDDRSLREEVSSAAAFLLPIAEATDWPCRLELVAWLIALRDTFGTSACDLN